MKTSSQLKLIANREFVKASVLLVLLFAIIPLLSNDAVDPWGVLAPRRVLGLFSAMLALQFAGFVFIQLFGETRGVFLAGFLGGLVSSTAVHILAAEKIKHRRNTQKEIFAECFAAILSSIVLMLFIVGYSSAEMLRAVLPPSTSFIVLLFFLFYLLNKRHIDMAKAVEGEKHPDILTKGSVTSPLQFKKAFQFAIVLISVLLVIGYVRSKFGAEAMMIAAFLTGLFELHSTTMSLTSGLENISPEALHQVILALGLAIVASILSKGVLVALLCRNLFSIRILAAYLITCALSFSIWYFSI